MTNQSAPRSARLVGAWVLVTAAGFFLGYILARLTFNFGLTQLTYFGVLPKWVLAGAGVGILQMRLLRPHLKRPSSWAVATTLGFTLGGLVASIPDPEPANQIVHWAVAGGITGTAQWMVLRSRLHGAGLWAPTSAVAWGLAGVARTVSIDALPETVDMTVVSMVAWGLAGLIIALISGLAITSLLAPAPPPR